MALRDGAGPMPAAGVAISPWVDLSCSGASFQTNARYDFVGERHCRLAAVSYLGAVDPRSPTVSPLFGDLRAAALLVQAGGAEVLVDQIRAFAARALEAGVDVRRRSTTHLMRDVTPAGQRAIDESARSGHTSADSGTRGAPLGTNVDGGSRCRRCQPALFVAWPGATRAIPSVSPSRLLTCAASRPLLIQAGGAEVLVDPIRAYADRVREAGVASRCRPTTTWCTSGT